MAESHMVNYGKVHHKCQQHDNLLPKVNKRKLRWYGRNSKAPDITKTILHGNSIKRKERRCEDNINDWTGLQLANLSVQLNKV